MLHLLEGHFAHNTASSCGVVQSPV
jgi:hypothetical protein